MNVKVFKRLIKEAVSEAIYEELPDILNEVLALRDKQVLKENKTFSFNSSDVHSFDPNARKQLAEKMGNMFGISSSTPSYQSSVPLEVIKDKVDEVTGEPVNPYLAFIMDSANNMTPQERAGLKNLGD